MADIQVQLDKIEGSLGYIRQKLSDPLGRFDFDIDPLETDDRLDVISADANDLARQIREMVESRKIICADDYRAGHVLARAVVFINHKFTDRELDSLVPNSYMFQVNRNVHLYYSRPIDGMRTALPRLAEMIDSYTKGKLYIHVPQHGVMFDLKRDSMVVFPNMYEAIKTCMSSVSSGKYNIIMENRSTRTVYAIEECTRTQPVFDYSMLPTDKNEVIYGRVNVIPAKSQQVVRVSWYKDMVLVENLLKLVDSRIITDRSHKYKFTNCTKDAIHVWGPDKFDITPDDPYLRYSYVFL